MSNLTEDEALRLNRTLLSVKSEIAYVMAGHHRDEARTTLAAMLEDVRHMMGEVSALRPGPRPWELIVDDDPPF